MPRKRAHRAGTIRGSLRGMRTKISVAVCAALVGGLWLNGFSAGRCLAQTGPLPTAAVNPPLGAPPPGGHLDETMPRPGAVVPNPRGAVVQPGTEAETGGHLGTPPVAAVPNAATGAVAPPARAVPNAATQAAPAVPPPAAGAVPPAGR